MAVYKLHSEEYDEIDYQLIAIHTTLEDYRLAYFINKSLPVLFSKSKNDVSILNKETEIQFSRFMYEDESKDVIWNLVQNKNENSQDDFTVNTGLFTDSKAKISTKTYLIPEYKKVDYFLKIENALSAVEIQNTISLLKEIDKISTVYTVPIENIKSKDNLIF
jgi:hypothetical protein